MRLGSKAISSTAPRHHRFDRWSMTQDEHDPGNRCTGQHNVYVMASLLGDMTALVRSSRSSAFIGNDGVIVCICVEDLLVCSGIADHVSLGNELFLDLGTKTCLWAMASMLSPKVALTIPIITLIYNG